MEKQGTALSIRTANEVVMDEKNGTRDKALAKQNGHMENGIAMPEKGQTKIVINPEVKVKTVKKDSPKDKTQHIGFFALVSGLCTSCMLVIYVIAIKVVE